MTAAKDKAKQPAQGSDVAAIERMNTPIDIDADYRIPGAVIAQLYQAIDEVPMKYARQLLPLVAMNVELIKDEG